MKIKKITRKRVDWCDCSIGIDETSRSPRILMCKNKAVYDVEADTKSPLGKQWYRVCEDCLPRMKKYYAE